MAASDLMSHDEFARHLREYGLAVKRGDAGRVLALASLLLEHDKDLQREALGAALVPHGRPEGHSHE